ncbi:hypothetical protein QVD17_05167 [Tagetes erecta]|uniref:Uncharacterized protein n=1 Tax=Tagetes erecta TaxID=13708 RepID=A0AAD8PBA5_TARER|nr:hypothetical protein QVD17_05167 [Tagetes erecta]
MLYHSLIVLSLYEIHIIPYKRFTYRLGPEDDWILHFSFLDVVTFCSHNFLVLLFPVKLVLINNLSNGLSLEQAWGYTVKVLMQCSGGVVINPAPVNLPSSGHCL